MTELRGPWRWRVRCRVQDALLWLALKAIDPEQRRTECENVITSSGQDFLRYYETPRSPA